MTKVMTIVGTRPEIIKLSRVISELDRQVEHVLVHTCQNYDYELNDIFFSQLGIRAPDHLLKAAGTNAAQTIGNVIVKSDEVMEAVRPDALLILGDTNSCLAAIAAKRRKIPIFHMEAGNRCFDQRVPEEINRKIVDHISDINLPYTEHARRYLLSEGIRPETIIKTGSPLKEVLQYHGKQIEESDILKRLDLQPERYIAASIHREENVDDPDHLADLLHSLSAAAEQFKMPVIVSTHPRTRKRLDELGIGAASKNVSFIKPLGFCDYIQLQSHAFCVISDSGSLTEESSIMNFPAISIRQANERPEGMDIGTLIMSGLVPERVLESVKIATSQHKPGTRAIPIVPDYNTENVSQQVVRVIVSHIDYINRTVWFK